jgi:hypothetical protein
MSANQLGFIQRTTSQGGVLTKAGAKVLSLELSSLINLTELLSISNTRLAGINCLFTSY